MTELVLRDIRLTAVIEFPVQHSMTFQSSNDTFFDKARMKNICKDLVCSGLLHDAVKTTYRRYLRVPRLVRWYQEALQLFEKVSDEAADSVGADGKDELGTTHLDSALLSK